MERPHAGHERRMPGSHRGACSGPDSCAEMETTGSDLCTVDHALRTKFGEPHTGMRLVNPPVCEENEYIGEAGICGRIRLV